MSAALPMRRTISYTEDFPLRVEKALKEKIQRLRDQGVDVPEWRRQLYREALERMERDGEL